MAFLCTVDEEEEFEDNEYGPGMMFAYWFENLMAITGWAKCNWDTQETSRRYWDHWHERRRSYGDI